MLTEVLFLIPFEGKNPYSFGLLTSFVSSCLFARLKFQCPVIGVVLNIWRMRPDALEAT